MSISSPIKQLNCPCKKQVKVVLNSQNVGCFDVSEVVTKSGGWKYLPLHDGETAWLCPSCSKKAKALAEKLVKLTGTVDFIVTSFVKRDEMQKL